MITHRLPFNSRAGWSAAAGCVLALAAACSRPHASATGTDLPTVAVAKAVRGDLSQTLTLAAEFRPFQQVEVHAKVAGYLKSIGVDVGDHVKAGQLLAVLEIPELQDEVKQDEAAVRRSVEEIRRAQADLERAQSNHDMSHLASTRLAAVAKERPNLIAQQDLDDATARDRMAEAQIATAKASQAAAEQQLEVAKANQRHTETLFGYARITAPFAGVITHRYADTGAMIQAGTSSASQAMPIVRLSETSTLRLIIPVPESAVARIRIGEPVDVHVDALARTFSGTVARFADSLNTDTRTMDTEVDVPNRTMELVPGMYASASIALAHAANVVTLPMQAIDRADKEAAVLVVKDGQIERHPIELGLETPDRIEVRSGVDGGDLVIVGNRSQLKPGMAVTPKVQ